MKTLMALTGLALVLFVLVHMLGNLQLFLGPHALNRYGKFLKSTGELLWILRLGLLTIFVLHVFSAIRLTFLNRAARPVKYQVNRNVEVSLPSRTLIVSGLIIFAFVAYHLAHFTFGWVDPSYLRLHDAEGRHDVFAMVVKGFSSPAVAWGYIVAMAVLWGHLWHAISRLFQSLGLSHPRYRPFLEKAGPVIATILALGNISMPLAVQLGWVRLVAGGH
jgi:succinate dehydrogenase / fumarate reductase cytochrome b subunit